jgi:cell division protein FtsI (penicillin-binding protein 3)
MAIVMDSPDHSMHFGAQASAPVFQDLAQQILEYLGVPHDQPMETPGAMEKAQQITQQDEPSEEVGDLNALFAEVNNLPADDPLRANPAAQERVPQAKAESVSPAPQPTLVASANTPPDPAAPRTSSDVAPSKPVLPEPAAPSVQPPPASPPPEAKGSVIVASAQRIAVPSFAGEPVRKVIEQAGSSGLAVQVLGSGIARGQAPAAGTMVPAGTEVVVRFGR